MFSGGEAAALICDRGDGGAAEAFALSVDVA